jgi:hypothetical protein
VEAVDEMVEVLAFQSHGMGLNGSLQEAIVVE